MNKDRASFLDIGTLLIAVPVAVPLVVVLAALFGPSSESWLHVRDNLLAEYVINTLLLLILTGLFAAAAGIITAWLCAQYDFPARQWLNFALVLPLALPTYVAGYIYAETLEYAGPVQSTLRELTGWGYGDYWFPAIRSLPGAALVMSAVLYPYVYLLVRANLDMQSGVLHQAARTLNVSGFSLLRRVTLPLARPAIAGGTALVLMETAAEFGVVQHFGVPTLTTGVFRTWLAMGERDVALKLAALLFMLVIVLVVMEQASRGGSSFSTSSPQGAATRVRLTGIRGWLAALVCAVPVLVGFAIPVALLTGHTIAEGDPLLGSRFSEFVTNTLTVSLIAAACCLAAAVWLAYTARTRKTTLTVYGIRLATLGYAIPGLVLATGAMIPLTAIDRWLGRTFDSVTTLLLTGSVAALVFVYVARFLTVAYNGVQGGMLQLHPSMDAAGRTLGASPAGVLTRIHLPLLRTTLTYAGLLVFIDVLKELPATLILRPFNFETLATRVYRLASDERLAEASTAALIIVLLSLVPTIILARRSNRTR